MSEPIRPDQPERVVVRDKRKIDPVTGEARRPDASAAADSDVAAAFAAADADAAAGAYAAAAAAAHVGPGQLDEAAARAAAAAAESDVPKAEALLLEERTRDLQRVQAEYANYRKRADRERLAAGELATGRILAELLPVLDDLDRAREHGDLTGGLKAVSERIDGIVGKLGLVSFGTVGDPFDPAVHEAVLHNESDEVSIPTCTIVMRRGYQHGERLLRPAMVGVSDPSEPAPAPDFAAPAAPVDTPADEPQG